MKIVPAILADSAEDFRRLIRLAEEFADYVQVDIMDGVLVPTKSFAVEEINAVETPLSFEVHLMAMDPQALADRIDHKGLKKVVFHFESDVDHAALAARLRARGLGAGLAIKPETSLDEVRKAAAHFDTLLFMTVDPGAYGSPFRAEVLGKVAEARRIFPRMTIAVDGGVSLDNLATVAHAGADYACVGSRIFLHDDPAERFRMFTEKAMKSEARRDAQGPARS